MKLPSKWLAKTKVPKVSQLTSKFPSKPAYLSVRSEVQNAKSRLKLPKLPPPHKLEILKKKREIMRNTTLWTGNELIIRVKNKKNKHGWVARSHISWTEFKACSWGAWMTMRTEPTMQKTHPKMPIFWSFSLSKKWAKTALYIPIDKDGDWVSLKRKSN